MRSNTCSQMRGSAVLILAAIWNLMILVGNANGQAPIPTESVRQVPAPLPKVALNGAVGENVSGIQYHRVFLLITNWDRYSSEMFITPIGRKLPPNPCAEAKTRIVLAVYSDRGALLSGCIPMPKPADLGKFSFLLSKGRTVPDFVYAVIHDRHTGAAYRSNLVSPWNGSTK